MICEPCAQAVRDDAGYCQIGDEVRCMQDEERIEETAAEEGTDIAPHKCGGSGCVCSCLPVGAAFPVCLGCGKLRCVCE